MDKNLTYSNWFAHQHNLVKNKDISTKMKIINIYTQAKKIIKCQTCIYTNMHNKQHQTNLKLNFTFQIIQAN